MSYAVYALCSVDVQQLDALLVGGGCQDAATAQQLQAVLARFVHFTRALNDSALHAVVQSLAALSMGALTQVGYTYETVCFVTVRLSTVNNGRCI
jgi:hypothetical protein